MDIHIRSEGCNDPGKVPNTCGIAYIKVNGEDHSLHRRGHNVVIVDAATGNLTTRCTVFLYYYVRRIWSIADKLRTRKDRRQPNLWDVFFIKTFTPVVTITVNFSCGIENISLTYCVHQYTRGFPFATGCSPALALAAANKENITFGYHSYNGIRLKPRKKIKAQPKQNKRKKNDSNSRTTTAAINKESIKQKKSKVTVWVLSVVFQFRGRAWGKVFRYSWRWLRW